MLSTVLGIFIHDNYYKYSAVIVMVLLKKSLVIFLDIDPAILRKEVGMLIVPGSDVARSTIMVKVKREY
jgi:hypothetical protein